MLEKKRKIVKLQVYQKQGNETFVDEFEAVDFDDFLIVAVDLAELDYDDIQEMHSKLEAHEKTVLMIDSNLDISFYGIVEEDDTDAS